MTDFTNATKERLFTEIEENGHFSLDLTIWNSFFNSNPLLHHNCITHTHTIFINVCACVRAYTHSSIHTHIRILSAETSKEREEISLAETSRSKKRVCVTSREEKSKKHGNRGVPGWGAESEPCGPPRAHRANDAISIVAALTGAGRASTAR